MYKLSDIKPYPGNPRINDQAVDAMDRSIQEFGFRQPIVVDTGGVIIIGHTRYKAALKLGPETVPVHMATNLSPEQIRAYRIADNRTSELSDWNYELLPIELGELVACDYDPGLLGFDPDEQLSYILNGLRNSFQRRIAGIEAATHGRGLCSTRYVPNPFLQSVETNPPPASARVVNAAI